MIYWLETLGICGESEFRKDYPHPDLVSKSLLRKKVWAAGWNNTSGESDVCFHEGKRDAAWEAVHQAHKLGICRFGNYGGTKPHFPRTELSDKGSVQIGDYHFYLRRMTVEEVLQWRPKRFDYRRQTELATAAD